ncbi:MAG: hypothetical protein J6F31_03285 [Oscillospiraceae bacterium]|nr:hypothetical protein [Oscillospiraceae bacterium]
MKYVEREIDSEIPLENLKLSNRAFNSLRRAGILTYRDLMLLTPADLTDIQNLGEKSISEIISLQEEYLENPPATIVPNEVDNIVEDYKVFEYNGMYFKNYALEDTDLSSRPYNCLRNAGINTLSELLMLSDREIAGLQNLGKKSALEIKEMIKRYTAPSNSVSYDSAEFSSKRQIVIAIHDEILRILAENADTGLSGEDLMSSLTNRYTAADVKNVLKKMKDNSQVVCCDGVYIQALPSFREIVESSTNEKQKKVFARRLEGATLEQVAIEEGLTRERIRQIEKRVLAIIAANGPVREDRFGYLFSRYDVDKDAFSRITGEEEDVYMYLALKYRVRGDKLLAVAHEDTRLPAPIRTAIHRAFGDYITVDGIKVRLTRTSVERFIIETRCIEEVRFDEFYEMYRSFIKEHSLQGHRNLMTTEGMYRTFENYVSQSRIVLWKQNRRFRYYDIDAGDYTELLSTLDLERYRDVHYSALKFFNKYPEVMERYDIRDEYELHNLLRKIYEKKGNTYIKFNKMPMIEFGEFDRDEAVRQLMFSLAPISIDDLSKIMYDEYGIRPPTVKSNWFNAISDYYINGMYITTEKPLPEEDTELLKKKLKADFYYISEIKDIYKKLRPDADLSLISSFNLRRLGFTVNSTYVISDKYPSARQYFSAILTAKERMDISELSARYTGIVSFSDNLSRLKDNYRIIEYAPYHIINSKGYQKMGINIRKIKTFCDDVADFVDDDVYFTVELIRSEGFESALDDLPFGNWFFSSLLREDDRFTHQKMGRTVLFLKGSKAINRAHFILDFINSTEYRRINEIRAQIFDIYGIDVVRWDIISAAEGHGYYHDRDDDVLIETALSCAHTEDGE